MSLAAALLEIERSGGIQAQWSLAAYEDEIKSADSRFFHVRHADGQISAFVFYRVVADEAWIMHLAVRDKQRGQGLHLMRAFLRELQQGPALRVGLEVAADNVAALSLYKATGFEYVGRRKAYYKNGQDAEIWIKKF